MPNARYLATGSVETRGDQLSSMPHHVVCASAGLLAALVSTAALAAGLSPVARTEIEYLLDYLEHSGCRFERNGRWYDAADARAHMERKLNWLLKRDLVGSAEQFIQRAATESSRSGKPYRVQCESDDPVDSAAWFRAELTRSRGTSGGEANG